MEHTCPDCDVWSVAMTMHPIVSPQLVSHTLLVTTLTSIVGGKKHHGASPYAANTSACLLHASAYKSGKFREKLLQLSATAASHITHSRSFKCTKRAK